MTSTEKLGYACVIVGVVLATLSLVMVGGREGYFLATINGALIASAVVCIYILRRARGVR